MRPKVTLNDVLILAQLGILIKAGYAPIVESMSAGSAHPVDESHIYKRLEVLVGNGYVNKIWARKDIMFKGRWGMGVKNINAVTYTLTGEGLECLRLERSKLLAMCDLIDRTVPP